MGITLDPEFVGMAIEQRVEQGKIAADDALSIFALAEQDVNAIIQGAATDEFWEAYQDVMDKTITALVERVTREADED